MKDEILKQLTENEDSDFDKLREDVVVGLKAGKPFLIPSNKAPY